MDNEKIIQMKQGFRSAFIENSTTANLAYKPQFISNNHKEGRKVLSSIEDELLSCEEFYISVAFITMSGITPLLQTLQILENKKIPGYILTTNYLNFSEPKALNKLAELKNITIKMYASDETQEGFHTKGYIFKTEEIYRIIVGSSNMTLSAMTQNREWNTKIVSTETGGYTKELLAEFWGLWNSNYSLDYETFIAPYTLNYNIIKKQRDVIKKTKISSLEAYKLQPNSMQIRFIQNLQKIREAGEKRALLISATGTGKTYASAFALREDNPSKALFLVHREQIAKQAIESYKKVFSCSKNLGLLSGNSKDYGADYLFATMQTMAKPETLKRFRKNEFQTIIIDEAHRIGASSYSNIMNYFKPQFWLGMTASPERMDNFDVYQAFDHNIAYEIRLQQALEENLLCPFHYFGITDLQFDGDTINDETALKDFNVLTSDERVSYVIGQAKYYGFSGERVKGLVFCSSKNEAAVLSSKFNHYGFETVFLSGDDSQEAREEAIDRLVSEDIKNKLDYIFSVDIFNEGVDIPEINQVIMLRPTQSPIVFVQQLGRGLRKAPRKEYVVILDFIGNYKNNFMIPIALSGDHSYNKDNIRRYLLEGGRIIPGASIIHFDEISKKRIFAAIDAANFSNIALIKENYNNLKLKLGHIPALQEFDKYGDMDVLRIFDNKNLGSYYKFLVKYEKEYKIRLNQREEKIIEFVSRKLANGKRIHELELLSRMLTYHNGLLGILRKSLYDNYKISVTEKTERNIVNIMTNEFPTGTGKDTYSECIFIQQEEDTKDFKITESFGEMLQNAEFCMILKELIDFGISRYMTNYRNHYKDTNLVLYQKYTYEDVCRLLDWEKNGVAGNIGGYELDKKTKTLPVFIIYNKAQNIRDTIKYKDYFVSANKLIAVSKQGRTMKSEDVQNFLYAEQRGIKVELFIRKNKDDNFSKEFYYLGRMKATGHVKEIIMDNTNKTAVEIEWILDTPVREDIYQYIVKESQTDENN